MGFVALEGIDGAEVVAGRCGVLESADAKEEGVLELTILDCVLEGADIE